MVGMILGSPAQTAGVEQGDQLLGIDEMQVDGQSPFQAASAISGGDAEPDSIPEPTVRLQVGTDAGTPLFFKRKKIIFILTKMSKRCFSNMCMHLVHAAA